MYQKSAALVFAVVQAVGQLSYIRPFVTDFSPLWLVESTAALTAGAMILIYVISAPQASQVVVPCWNPLRRAGGSRSQPAAMRAYTLCARGQPGHRA